MIRACENLLPRGKKDKTYVFLAGPIQGAPDWHTQVPDLGDDVELICPKRLSAPVMGLTESEWKKQVEWETLAFRMSDIVLFWIPESIKDIPGRDYAQTTKIELMENLCRGKRIILGIDPKVNTRRYLTYKYETYMNNEYPVVSTLKDVVHLVKRELQKRKEASKKLYFTSDTHFNQQRTLELSRRPFRDLEDMNLTMIEKWNTIVPLEATVYHLGDFGDYDYVKYLNGNIKLILGNYERNDITKGKCTLSSLNKDFEVVNNAEISLDLSKDYGIGEVKLVLAHEPQRSRELLESNVGDSNTAYALFGHIHGRDLIKPFGIDVGVDAHGYQPISENKVGFFINALIKDYYDDEVFCR